MTKHLFLMEFLLNLNVFDDSRESTMAPYRKFMNFILLVMLAFWLSACGSSGGSDSDEPAVVEPFSYQVPVQRNDGWAVGDLNQLDIDPAPLESLINKIQNNDSGYLYIESLVIAQNGALLFDTQLRTELDFADGWAGNQNIDLHVVNSVTKSVTSALIGIAIDQGIISGVDVPVHDYFTHKQPVANWTANKASITIENWLNMRSGYEWDEWDVNYLNSSNLNSQMNNAADPIQFLLDRPMATQPGSTFAYSTGISYGLGRIIQLASGSSVQDYMQTNLLDPLQIDTFDYWSLEGQMHTGSALYLTSRDMAKFGQLYLDGGEWNGTRVISQEWVTESTQQRVDLNESGTSGYGYQWWMTQFTAVDQTYQSFYANGFGGQFIFVFPALELVVVMTGDAYQDGTEEGRSIRSILENEILPSFVSNVN